MENNQIYSQELEDMRLQMAILKERIARQTIINDTHIRNSMKRKMLDVTRIIAATIFIGAISLPYSTWIFYKFGFSWYFIVISAIMLIVCIGLTIKQRCRLGGLDFSHGNLVDVAERLVKVKRHYLDWVKIGLPMILIWAGWLAHEGVTNMEQGPILIGFLSGSAGGVVIGGITGFCINRKIVSKSTEILNQIRELRGDE